MSERYDYQLHPEFDRSAWSTLEEGGGGSARSDFDFHQSFLSTETNYLSERVQDRIKNDDQLTEEDKAIIQYLALRKFHMYVPYLFRVVLSSAKPLLTVFFDVNSPGNSFFEVRSPLNPFETTNSQLACTNVSCSL